jgi:hypothetical protein
VSIAIDRLARSRQAKAGLRTLFGKAPDADTVADRLGKLAKRMLRDVLVDAGYKGARYVVRLAVHPAAPRVKLAVESNGDIHVRAVTSSVGPGYHAAVVDLLEPVFDELDFTWAPAEVPDYIDHRSVPKLQQRFVDDLSDRLARRGDGQLRLAMPAHHAFRIDAPLVSALGPRDDAWVARAIVEPMAGKDVFAWWDPAEVGAYERSRALIKLWLDVPWREPLDDAEKKLMRSVDADLRDAMKANPDLELPWAAWAELLDNLGSEAGHVSRVEKRAAAAGGAGAIGYRRFDMDVEIAGGWSLVLPGNFVTNTEDDGERFWGTDGERAIEVTTLTASDDRSSLALLEVAAPRHPVIATLADGTRAGRAEAHDDDDVRVVHGLMASAPHVAILTCKGDATDEAWMLETWRSLRNDTRATKTTDDDE